MKLSHISEKKNYSIRIPGSGIQERLILYNLRALSLEVASCLIVISYRIDRVLPSTTIVLQPDRKNVFFLPCVRKDVQR
jgi:hypothetical protein